MKTKILSKSNKFFSLSFALILSFCIFGSSAFADSTPSNTITGHIYYANALNQGMFNSSLNLISEGVVIATTTTDVYGAYTFSGVPDGTYRIVPSTSLPWGGVNATDSYLMMLHFIQDGTISGIEFIASDVYRNGYINAMDALASARRFVGLDGTFAVGDFYFENPMTTISGGITQILDIQGIAYGDADASYNLGSIAKFDGTLSLEHSATLNPLAGQQISIPVSISNGEGINAISLSLGYNPDNMEISDIVSNIPEGSFIYNVSNGTIKISWFDVKSMTTNAGQPAFTITARLSSKLTGNQHIALELNPETEIAGDKGVRTSFTSIDIPEIKIGQTNVAASVSTSPNPVISDLLLNYISQNEGQAEVKVKNLLGEVIYSDNFELVNGSNSKSISLSDAPKGIYILEIWSGSKKLESRKIIKS